jgi:bacterioferritin-associated ferredoxin
MMDDLPKDAARKICLCMSVTDEEIGACFEAGHRDLQEIREITRACTRCYGCEADLTAFYTNILMPGKYRAPRRDVRTRVMRLIRRYGLYTLAQRYYHRYIRWRMAPLVFASVIIEREDLHSRVVIANVNREPGLTEFGDIDLEVQLLDHTGTLVYTKVHKVLANATLVLEGSAMIGGRGQGLAFTGTVIVKGKRRFTGSLRPYTHYYNDVSIASTHDQWTPDVTRHEGFCTMVRVPPHEPLVYFSVSNIEPVPYRSKVILTNHRGKYLESEVEVPPYGTMMMTASDLFRDTASFLDNQLGTLRFENWSHRAMYYFLAHNQGRNTWNVNHL